MNKDELTYKEIFKKYWFVMAVAVLLVVFVIAWAANIKTEQTENSDDIIQSATTKTIDEKYVLFDIDGGNEYYADEYYDVINKSSVTSIVLNDLLTIISEKEIKMNEEIRTMAANAASYQITNNTKEQLEDLMRTNGLKRYGNITKYFEKEYRNQMLIRQYLKDHLEDVVKDYLEETPVKKISHILVKVADVSETQDTDGNTIHFANPTEEETEKLNKVLEELKTRPFADVAKEYSEDGSAADGGFLSYSTDDEAASTYVAEFAEGVKNAEYDVATDVITSQYGYHIILVEKPEPSSLVEDMQIAQNIISANNSGNYLDMLAEYSNKLNIKIIDQDIIDVFNEYGTVTLNGQEEAKAKIEEEKKAKEAEAQAAAEQAESEEAE